MAEIEPVQGDNEEAEAVSQSVGTPHEPLFLYPGDSQQGREWLAVLNAAGIHPRVHRGPGGWTMVVPHRDRQRARTQIAAYEKEAQHWPPEWSRPLAAEDGDGLPSIAVALALLVAFVLTGEYNASRPWFETGAANAERIMAGELWRTVTALWLHGDLPHVASNALCCVMIGASVALRLGAGLGWLLILFSGILGNGLNAWFHGEAHISVGASTAVFGAIGLLGGQRAMEKVLGRAPINQRGVLGPILVVIACFGLLGIGESLEIDVMAHLFGALVGLGLGAVAPWFSRWRHVTIIQRACGLAAVLIVATAWFVALRSYG